MDDRHDPQLARLEAKLDKLLIAVYEGNGAPPLMTRVDRLEQRVARAGGWWAFLQSVVVAVITAFIALAGTGAL